MAYNNIIIEQKEKIAILTINRPSQLNALNKETISELSNAFLELEKNAQIKVIILTGAGEKAFVAGADIKEFFQFNVAQGKELSAEGHRKLFDLVENLSKPVIAAVNGFALGGGLELAMSCHFRIASDNAKLGLPEVTLGVIPGYGGTQRLAQLVGKGRAMEMIMTAKMISAQEAFVSGLVNQVTPLPELLETTQKIAEKIAGNSSTAISAAIRSVNAGFKNGVNGFQTEIEEFGKCFGTPHFTEGTSAFLDKRKPSFN
ncbi:MAG: enoyl-CoA hydratase/isomerase family protein [Flavobacteriales bacterium]|nr:enoyl-CoA hydratase/isomerase family protein [Flavobacteriales bacterium]